MSEDKDRIDELEEEVESLRTQVKSQRRRTERNGERINFIEYVKEDSIFEKSNHRKVYKKLIPVSIGCFTKDRIKEVKQDGIVYDLIFEAENVSILSDMCSHVAEHDVPFNMAIKEDSSFDGYLVKMRYEGHINAV
jgi:uncharacterized protein YkuJ